MNQSEQPLALVTGAASGIGKATTERLMGKGMRVVALDRSKDNLDALEREWPGEKLIPCMCDLADIQALPALLTQLVSEHGAIKYVVNNAGIWAGGPIVELSDEAWQLNFAVNVTSPFVMMRTLAPVMAKAGGGAIVSVSSRNAYRSSTNNSAYDASKAALLALTRTAAGEFAKYNIRVNAVCPGVIATPADPGIEENLFKDAYSKLIPMDRYGHADEIASVIEFLLLDDSSFMTGQALIVDGGQIACQDNQRFMEIPGLKD